MIYVCVPTHDNAQTVGLLLWKIRQVFGGFPREYHVLAADDGSTDATVEVLETYQRVLPMSVLASPERRGEAATLEALLREAVRRTDRPRRDVAIVVGADFAISPSALPPFIRRVESGADVVLGEAIHGETSVLGRAIRRLAVRLLRPGLTLPGVSDVLSGFCAIRLSTVRRCLRDRPNRFLETDGIPARAELLARTASHARQITVVALDDDCLYPRRSRPEQPFALMVALWHAGRRLRVAAPAATIERA